MADTVITQAKFLAGMLKMGSLRVDIMKQCEGGILKGDGPSAPAPTEWMDSYQVMVKEVTHMMCSDEFTHQMAIKAIADQVASTLLNKGLNDLTDLLKRK